MTQTRGTVGVWAGYILTDPSCQSVVEPVFGQLKDSRTYQHAPSTGLATIIILTGKFTT